MIATHQPAACLGVFFPDLVPPVPTYVDECVQHTVLGASDNAEMGGQPILQGRQQLLIGQVGPGVPRIAGVHPELQGICIHLVQVGPV